MNEMPSHCDDDDRHRRTDVSVTGGGRALKEQVSIPLNFGNQQDLNLESEASYLNTSALSSGGFEINEDFILGAIGWDLNDFPGMMTLHENECECSQPGPERPSKTRPITPTVEDDLAGELIMDKKQVSFKETEIQIQPDTFVNDPVTSDVSKHNGTSFFDSTVARPRLQRKRRSGILSSLAPMLPGGPEEGYGLRKRRKTNTSDEVEAVVSELITNVVNTAIVGETSPASPISQPAPVEGEGFKGFCEEVANTLRKKRNMLRPQPVRATFVVLHRCEYCEHVFDAWPIKFIHMMEIHPPHLQTWKHTEPTILEKNIYWKPDSKTEEDKDEPNNTSRCSIEGDEASSKEYEDLEDDVNLLAAEEGEKEQEVNGRKSSLLTKTTLGNLSPMTPSYFDVDGNSVPETSEDEEVEEYQLVEEDKNRELSESIAASEGSERDEATMARPSSPASCGEVQTAEEGKSARSESADSSSQSFFSCEEVSLSQSLKTENDFPDTDADHTDMESPAIEELRTSDRSCSIENLPCAASPSASASPCDDLGSDCVIIGEFENEILGEEPLQAAALEDWHSLDDEKAETDGDGVDTDRESDSDSTRPPRREFSDAYLFHLYRKYGPSFAPDPNNPKSGDYIRFKDVGREESSSKTDNAIPSKASTSTMDSEANSKSVDKVKSISESGGKGIVDVFTLDSDSNDTKKIAVPSPNSLHTLALRSRRALSDAKGSESGPSGQQQQSKPKSSTKSLLKNAVRPIPCVVCTTTLPADEMEEHFATHVMECHICGDEDVPINEGFAEHGRRHVGLLVNCEREGCKYEARNRLDLWQHANKEHFKVRPWICVWCGDSFPTRAMLTLHRKSIHRES